MIDPMVILNQPQKTVCPFFASRNPANGIDRDICMISDKPCPEKDWLKCTTAAWELADKEIEEG